MDTTKGVILIVDDQPINLSVLMQMLEASQYKVLVATSGEAALEQVVYAAPDLILLDILLPGMNGFETCRRLKAGDQTREIPVIFMTVLTEISDKIQGFEAGGVDYITKPFQQAEVEARIHAHLTLHRQKQEIQRLREQDRLYHEKLSRIKDDLLQTVSHDLKNPLTTILATVDLLKHTATSDNQQTQRKLEIIQNEALCMREMIGNLLDLARLEAGIGLQKKEVALRSLLERSIQRAMISAQQNDIDLHAQLPDDELRLPCDAVQIEQVLQNLLSNAIKYTGSGGRVTVSTKTQRTGVIVQVADTGLGIPEQDVPHLFEKFYRVNTQQHRQVSGTGLGLSIVQQIVEQHGGSVQVKSEPGAGSTFSVFLPR